MPDTPADTLRAAAARIREHATDALHASPLPWAIKTSGYYGNGAIVAANRDIVADRSDVEPGEAIDLPYIALMHPGVGKLIADWLESAARTWEFVTYSNRDAALAVARAVLDSRDS